MLVRFVKYQLMVYFRWHWLTEVITFWVQIPHEKALQYHMHILFKVKTTQSELKIVFRKPASWKVIKAKNIHPSPSSGHYVLFATSLSHVQRRSAPQCKWGLRGRSEEAFHSANWLVFLPTGNVTGLWFMTVGCIQTQLHHVSKYKRAVQMALSWWAMTDGQKCKLVSTYASNHILCTWSYI